MKLEPIHRIIALCVCLSIPAAAHAQDVFTLKTIGMELARDIASETVLACRKQATRSAPRLSTAMRS